MNINKEVFELIFPQGTFEWFDITDGKRNIDEKGKEVTHITLIEKDIPPLSEEDKNKKIVRRRFHDITITDFPLRGRKTLLTIRRRYWQIEGEEDYLKRDIKLNFPGTKLEKEFADFLKDRSGDPSTPIIYDSESIQAAGKRI